jgi:hypothetical protein
VFGYETSFLGVVFSLFVGLRDQMTLL